MTTEAAGPGLRELDMEPFISRIETLGLVGAAHISSWVESYGHIEGPDPECPACDDIFSEANRLRELVAEVERLRAALAETKDDAPGHCENCRAAVPLTTVHLCATCLPAAPSEHRAALAEAGRSSLPEGWQPIETAPKDGTQVFVSGVGWAAMGSWRGDRWWTYAALIGARPLLDGKRSVSPNYWQPLPAPPASLPLSAGEPQ